MSCYLFEYKVSDGHYDFISVNAKDYLDARDIFYDAYNLDNEVLHVYVRLF